MDIDKLILQLKIMTVKKSFGSLMDIDKLIHFSIDNERI